MATNDGPSAAVMRRVEALYAVIESDASFARLRRLMEVDWTEADATVEEVGLPRLLDHHARKLDGLAAQPPPIAWPDVADAIRYTERHDETARTALWWLMVLGERVVSGE